MTSPKKLPSAGLPMVEHLCFRLLPLQILLAAVGAINGTLSSLFASNYIGAQAMSAVGLYTPIRQFVSAVGILLLGGAQILCGKYMGQTRQDRAHGIFSLNLVLSTLFSVIVALLMAGTALFDLTGFFTDDRPVRIFFNQYLLGTALGIPPMILGQQLSGFLSLENRAGRATAASVAYLVSNLALNFLFVAHLQMGILGLALASSLGLWIFFGVQALYYLRGRSELKLRLKSLRWQESGALVRIGVPSALSNGYLSVRALCLNALILSFAGSAGLSAFTACNAFMDFFWAIPGGMLAVSRMLMSISYGEEDRESLQNVFRVLLRRYMPLLTAIALLLSALAVPLARLYYPDHAEPLFTMTVWGFRLLPLAFPFSSLCAHYVCYGQISGKQVPVHLLSVLDGLVSVVIFSALLLPHMGMIGVYAATLLNGLVTTLVVLLYPWACTGRFPRSTDTLLALPREFGVPQDARMDLTVHGMQDVVSISRRVQQFCLSRGIDARRAYFAALAIEEMAGNVVKHGFAAGRKRHTADLRVVCSRNCVILRIRDNCAPFDPSEKRAVLRPEDPTHNIGIRMVFSLAKKVHYQNILGLNALTIHF